MPFVPDPSSPLPVGMQKQVWNSNHPEDPVEVTDADFGGSTSSSTSSSSSSSSTTVGSRPSDLDAARQLADQAAYREYLKARLELDREQGVMRDEREKDRIANERARDAWTRTYQTAQLSGYMPESGDWGGGTAGTAGQAIPGTYATKNGNKTTAQMRAELATAGYPDASTADDATIAAKYAETTGGPVTPATTAGTAGTAGPGRGQRVLDAIGQLRADARYQAADGMTRQQMEAAAVAQATGVPLSAAAQTVARLRQLTATTGQMSSAGLIESILAQTPGGAVPTLDREKEQNQTTIQALTLLSQLRGPENAFAYANTLANLPESIRSNIQAAMGRLPFTAQNPAQRGLFGDVGLQQQAAMPGGMTPGGMEMYGQQGMPTATGPRTALSYLPAPQAAAPQQPAQNLTGQAAGNVPVTQPTPAPGSLMAQGWTGGPNGQEIIRSPQPTYGPRTQPANVLPFRAGGLSPTDINRANPYAQKLMWAGYENAGGDIAAGQWEYANSLPRAYGPRTGRYRPAA